MEHFENYSEIKAGSHEDFEFLGIFGIYCIIYMDQSMRLLNMRTSEVSMLCLEKNEPCPIGRCKCVSNMIDRKCVFAAVDCFYVGNRNQLLKIWRECGQWRKTVIMDETIFNCGQSKDKSYLYFTAFGSDGEYLNTIPKTKRINTASRWQEYVKDIVPISDKKLLMCTSRELILAEIENGITHRIEMWDKFFTCSQVKTFIANFEGETRYYWACRSVIESVNESFEDKKTFQCLELKRNTYIDQIYVENGRLSFMAKYGQNYYGYGLSNDNKHFEPVYEFHAKDLYIDKGIKVWLTTDNKIRWKLNVNEKAWLLRLLFEKQEDSVFHKSRFPRLQMRRVVKWICA